MENAFPFGGGALTFGDALFIGGAGGEAVVLPGAFPGGAFPGGAFPGGALPGGALPGGALPGGALPGGALPGGALLNGALHGVHSLAATC